MWGCVHACEFIRARGRERERERVMVVFIGQCRALIGSLKLTMGSHL